MNQTKINFVFFGTPDVARETLEILKDSGSVPSLIVTSPDRPAGRKMLLTPPPVKVWAEENNIPYIQPENKAELLSVLSSRGSHSEGEGRSDEKMKEARADIFIVVAYGKIIAEEILNMPKYGSLNIHYSLLPQYRGASPVESAILNGETETGVTIQKMIFKLDAGEMVAQEKLKIMPDETAPELRKRLIKLGSELLVKTLPNFIEEKITPIPQDESRATHCGKIKKEDGLIDLNDDATKNYNKFRAYATWPRTFFFKDGKRIIITQAKLEDGKFVIQRVIPEGGKEIEYRINT
jgi:methionyl-tRNA formyltransferase